MLFRHRAPRSAAAALLALAALMAACTSGPGNEPDPDEKPVAGGTLRVSSRDLSTLDPAKATGRGAALVLSQVFDSLTDVDATGAVIPAAADRWETSSDGKTWTFHLVPASFHDGAAVTAYDFKFAFDRITSKSIASEAAFQLEPVSGFKAARIDGTANTLSGVTVVNLNTLRIQLDRPFYELPVYLAHWALGPISQKVFNRDPNAFAAQPIGNGPFKISASRTDQGVALERNDNHAGSTAYLEGMKVTVSTDTDSGFREFLRDDTDIAEVPSSGIETARGKIGPRGFTPFWAAVYYGPNLRLDKFKKPEVRRAIAYAVNRAAIASTVYGGTKSPATGIVPATIPGFTGQRCAECVFDPAKARALIKEAFAGAAPEIVIDHLDASPSREVATAIAANLREVGLPSRLRAHDSGEYLRLLEAGGQELAELGWLSEVPTSDGFLAQQLKSGSPNNQVAFADAQFDAAIDRARSERDDAKRQAAYRAAEARALDQMALIPVVYFRNHLAVADRVRGFRLDGAGLFDAARVWLASGR